jgi:hypothetical protein
MLIDSILFVLSFRPDVEYEVKTSLTASSVYFYIMFANDNSDSVIREIYHHVHPDIRKDLEFHLLYGKKKCYTSTGKAFDAPGKKYDRLFHFNYHIGVDVIEGSEYELYWVVCRKKLREDEKFSVTIFYNKTKGIYRIELSDGPTCFRYGESEDWERIKEMLETFFNTRPLSDPNW